ncbi:MAG: hypothetical protein FWD26_00245 [Treponema sp.]|nr:hypothetical protein [Treponema sp.]
MSKNHRGKGIRDQFAHGRGECPVCKRNSVKILYEQEAEGQKFKICKVCKAAVKNGKKSLPVVKSAEAPKTDATAG